MRLSYDEPITMARATGVWMTDAEGIDYLDAYNNVPHVGHCRPEVVAAIAEQAARLNTNTRYLVAGVTEYAERLASRFPPPLDTVLFANSGSEANDLAWRIARTVTGHDGFIVTENAYHGATALTMATSPEEVGRLEPWVGTVAAPDTFDGAHAGPEAGDAYAGLFDEAAGKLNQASHQLAAFACDTIFSSDGIFVPPDGYLAEVYRKARNAGGLCIADEVQAGFGRLGEMWGFDGHGVVPDIVTLGKPMGNGEPIAAVVTSSPIADAFFEDAYYFSTFAGNPVSVAAARAVLDILENDDLLGHAGRLGAHLRGEIGRIGDGSVVDIRGKGLFIGVELAVDAATTQRVVEDMRRRRVLIGRTGPEGNVLKIRPPLVFGEEHTAILTEALAGSLATV
jgi:4-aminobutyrate aminotransferase-like enzyme